MLKTLIKKAYYDTPRIFSHGKVFPCRNVIIELTYSCNLSCPMCSIRNEIGARKQKPVELELEHAEICAIIDQLPLKSNITFTGGEVLIKKGFTDILEKASTRHKISLASNGLLLHDYSELLVDTAVMALGVSLDGPPAVHDHVRNKKGVFTKLENGLRSLSLAKLRKGSQLPIININCVILNENYKTLPKIVPLAKNLGANSCTFQILDPSLSRSGLSLKEMITSNDNPLDKLECIDPITLRRSLKTLLHEGEKHRVTIRFLPALTVDEIVLYYQKKFDLVNWKCNQPWRTMRISPYGDVYPCLNYYIGNVRHNSLNHLWNHHNYSTFRGLLKQQSLFKACIGCCKMTPKQRR